MTNDNIAWQSVNLDIAEAVENIEKAQRIIEHLADILSDRTDTAHFKSTAEAVQNVKYKVRGLRG